MKNLLAAGALGLVFSVTMAVMLDAAPPRKRLGRPTLQRNNSPVIDPAVNMLNSTNSLETNVFLRMLPEQQHLAAEANQRRDLRQLRNRVRKDEDQQGQQRETQATHSKLGATGHSTGFLTYGNYFPLGQSSQGER